MWNMQTYRVFKKPSYTFKQLVHKVRAYPMYFWNVYFIDILHGCWFPLYIFGRIVNNIDRIVLAKIKCHPNYFTFPRVRKSTNPNKMRWLVHNYYFDYCYSNLSAIYIIIIIIQLARVPLCFCISFIIRVRWNCSVTNNNQQSSLILFETPETWNIFSTTRFIAIFQYAFDL